ncbi:MAG: hypothetical protein M0Q92_08225 [Methanoregula sp.]|nr:hypothetical protein [Methanoregula sp.]
MKLPVVGIVAMVILIIALAAAGCTDATARTPDVADVPVVTPALVPAAVTQTKTIASVPTTPACANPPLNPWWGVPESYVSPLSREAKSPPAPGTLISKADLYGTPTHTWEEYDRTAQIQDLPDSSGTTRCEISKENRKGRPEVHKRIIQTTHLDGAPPEQDMETTTDVFYDEFHAILSQHTRSVSGTGATTENDGPPDSRAGAPHCSGRIFAPVFTYVGTESLTVPAGTFPDARKYTEDIADDPLFGKSATSTHWFAPGVPAELKRVLESQEKHLLMTWELTDWGGTMK